MLGTEGDNLVGAELDLFAVAEGIETQAHHDVLVELGCALGQGYLYGHPWRDPRFPWTRHGASSRPTRGADAEANPADEARHVAFGMLEFEVRR